MLCCQQYEYNVEQDIISCVGRVAVVFVVCNCAVSDISIVSNASNVGDVSIVRRVSSVSDVSIVCNKKKITS